MTSGLMERVRRLKFLWLAVVGGAAALLIWDVARDVPQEPVAYRTPAQMPEALTTDLAPVDLPIENISQQTQVWCWAAVSQQLIAASRGMANTPSQCQLVAAAYGADPGPCCAGQDQRCVTTGSLQQIQALIQQRSRQPQFAAAGALGADADLPARVERIGGLDVLALDRGEELAAEEAALANACVDCHGLRGE